MLNLVGTTTGRPDRVSRRQILQAGGAGLLGLSVPRLLAAESARPAMHGRAKSVIFLFLFGGPSQLETFDMKPDAPSKVRGPFKPIASRNPELRISEHLPRLAERADRFSVLKTLTHSYNDHSGAGHYIQTGHRWHVPIGGGFNTTPKDWPSMGSVVEHTAQQRAGDQPRDLPAYVVLPNYLGALQETLELYRPGEYAGWLGRGYDPLTTSIGKRDPKDNPYWRDCSDDELTFQIQGLVTDASLTSDRLSSRKSLLEQFDDGRRKLDSGAVAATYDRFQQRALAMVTSPRTRSALDIRRESDALRDRYGRHLFGQSTLMARRLVEAGVRFVTVHYDCVDGYSWDSHRSAHHLENHLLPTFDQALAALLDDLDERGLLDETLVVAMGEMGRTPVAANDAWGRGHWSTLFPAVLAGAGVKRGAVVGKTDRDAAHPVELATSPEDLAATIYHALGIDPESRLSDRQGRPVSIVENGQPVLELFG